MRWTVKKTLILIVLVLITFILIASLGPDVPQNDLKYGLTFSPRQARDLGLDWKKTYLAILDDLKAKNLRLSAYWNEVEPEPGQWNFSDLDWLIDEASARQANIILAVGGRLPRWPECHFPGWALDMALDKRQEATLNYIRETVNRYKGNPAISYWQVENEPFLNHFGECPPLEKDFLDKEIALVRSLDSRPIVITDSGELSLWVPAARRGDIFGTTMYRDTYSRVLDRYIHYPINPGFFHFKKNLASLFASPEKWIVIELQAEPWGPKPYDELTQEDRNRTMTPTKFREIIDFSAKTGFGEFYLWGAEWWYWEREANRHNDLWEEAKKLFESSNN